MPVLDRGWRHRRTGPCAAGLDEHRPDPDTTTTFMVGQMQRLFEKLDDAGKRQAEAKLHQAMAADAGQDGVRLGSGAWIVTARRWSRKAACRAAPPSFSTAALTLPHRRAAHAAAEPSPALWVALSACWTCVNSRCR